MRYLFRRRARGGAKFGRLLVGVFFVLALTCGGATQSAAQDVGIVQGIARDASSQAVAGADLRLEAADGSVVGRTTTDANGHYSFKGVAPGRYTVVAEKPGANTARTAITVGAQAGANADLTLAAQPASSAPAAPAQKPAEEITVTAQRLNAARNNIEPNTGASTYGFTSQTIESMPGGENAPLNQVLLQAPGVDQDSQAYGTLHVRNEHLNVQYRINGVVLPDGLSFFGQGLSPRFIDSMSLVTGALPAEYGLRTAGIVDIQTKSGIFQNGGSIETYGGSYGTFQPSGEYGGSVNGYNYYVASDYLQSDHGINAVTPSYNAVHDGTQQGHAFAYLEKIIDPSSKASLIAGSFTGTFQIPDNPGQAPVFGPSYTSNPTPNGTINGSTNFNSSATNERQNEGSYFAVASYLRSEEDFDYQISAFTKYSVLHFLPDMVEDIAFNGIAQNALRQDFANGLQAEGTYRLGGGHTLRGGVILNEERTSADTTNYVLPIDTATGIPTSSTPLTIVADSEKTGWTYSTFLQDEWKVLPAVTVNYGGRFDVVNTSTMENQISPRFNTVWQATPSTTVHAGYANYFTPPPFELFSAANLAKFAGTSADCSQNGPGTSETGTCLNSPVKSERDQYFDGGVTQDVLPGLKVGVDLYYKEAQNLIDEGQFGAPVILTAFNYRVARNRGAEITTSYDNGPFSYYGNLAIAQQKAEDITAAQFNFTPQQLQIISEMPINTDHSQLMTASAGLSYLWDGTRYSVDMLAGTGLRSEEPSNPIPNGSTVPSYEQVNLGISHRFEDAPGGPIEIRADLINVFDESYMIRSGTGIGVFASQYGPRRTFFLGVRKFFGAG